MTLTPDVTSDVTSDDLVRSVERALSAAQIDDYRRAVHAITPDAPALADGIAMASPVQPFVLAWSAFDSAVASITNDPEPTVVHLSQEIYQDRPVAPDELVHVELDVLGARKDKRGVQLGLRSRLIDTTGTVFGTQVTMLLAVGAEHPDTYGELPRHPVHKSDADPVVVESVIPVDFPPQYAVVSGDTNPIHVDEAAAIAAGQPGIIAHGMSVVALVVEDAIGRFAEGDASRIRGLGTRFSAPVQPGVPIEISYAPNLAEGQIPFSVRTPDGLALKNGWIDVAD